MIMCPECKIDIPEKILVEDMAYFVCARCGECVTLHVSELNRHGTPVSKVRFAPSGKYLASTSYCTDPRELKTEVVRENIVKIWKFEDEHLEGLVEITIQGAPILDLAWHPNSEMFGITGLGRQIELYQLPYGTLLNTVGERIDPNRTNRYHVGGPNEFELKCPTWSQGISNICFTPDGERFIAGDCLYDTSSGRIIQEIWPTDTTLALHPEHQFIATLSSNQAASTISFADISEHFQAYDIQLNVERDGYERIMFSSKGDRLGIVGYCGKSFTIFDFPSCERVHTLQFGPLKRLSSLFTKATKRAEGSHVTHDWRLGDRIVLTPDSRGFIMGLPSGRIVWGDFETDVGGMLGEHTSMVMSLDFHPTYQWLATADWGGVVKIFRWDGACNMADQRQRPLSSAFTQYAKKIAYNCWQDFRQTDGERFYDDTTIAKEDDLPDTAPAWAQIMQTVARVREKGKDEPSIT